SDIQPTASRQDVVQPTTQCMSYLCQSCWCRVSGTLVLSARLCVVSSVLVQDMVSFTFSYFQFVVYSNTKVCYSWRPSFSLTASVKFNSAANNKLSQHINASDLYLKQPASRGSK